MRRRLPESDASGQSQANQDCATEPGLLLARRREIRSVSLRQRSNTNSLLDTIGGLGIQVGKVDAGSVAAVQAALQPNTRMVFVETIANPGTQIPDLVAISELCRAHGLVYVVDNTITSPALFRPRAGVMTSSCTRVARAGSRRLWHWIQLGTELSCCSRTRP
jgi:hypothetical protein